MPLKPPSTMHIALISSPTPQTSLAAEHKKRIKNLRETLRHFGLKTKLFLRDDIPTTLDNFDWVIAAGGDGSILDAAWRCTDVPLSGVRLFPELSVGFLADVDPKDFERLVQNIVNGQGVERKLHRLQAFIDDKALPQAILNDILFCKTNPARASKYRLSYGDICQNQCSSGLWISTAAGSHAAIASYGLERYPIDAQAYLFAVRELCLFAPIDNDDGLPAIQSGHFLPPQTPVIIPRDDDNAIYADGDMWQHTLKAGENLSFGEHPKALKKWGLKS